VLVDTDVFSFLLTQRGRWEEFARLIDGHPLVLSFATVGELRAGAIKAGYGEKRVNQIERRIAECVVVPATDRIATIYGGLHARFRDNLKKDGSNDMWTAACSLAETPPLPVVTNNLADFQLLATDSPFLIVHPDL
jgi:predicted nucleic acid-binding protein